MKLPKQAKPVIRNSNTTKFERGINPHSDCTEACNQITGNGNAKAACIMACNAFIPHWGL